MLLPLTSWGEQIPPGTGNVGGRCAVWGSQGRGGTEGTAQQSPPLVTFALALPHPGVRGEGGGGGWKCDL